jgi:hypothetical protein
MIILLLASLILIGWGFWRGPIGHPYDYLDSNLRMVNPSMFFLTAFAVVIGTAGVLAFVLVCRGVFN